VQLGRWNETKINITELLKRCGLDLNARIEMMRRLSKTYDVYDMYVRNLQFQIRDAITAAR